MSAVGLLAAGDIRRRWRSAVGLALLVGVVGAIVLSTSAGARRTSTSLARFNAFSQSSDLGFDAAFGYSPTPAQMAAVRRVPNVEAVSVLRFFAVKTPFLPKGIGLGAAVDNTEGEVIDRSRVVRGRRANPDAAGEVNIDAPLAARLHLSVGSPIDLVSYTPAQVQGAASSSSPPPAPAGPNVRLEVVGIVRRPIDIGETAIQSGGFIVLTPGFNRAYFDRIGNLGVVLNVRTVHGTADGPLVTAAFQKVFQSSGGVSPQTGTASDSKGAQEAIDVLSLALWILAGVIAVAGAVTIAIVFSRDMSRASVDQATLCALGLTHRQRVLTSAPRAVLIAVVGTVLAAVGAVAVSPLFPIGIARLADPNVGLHVDWVVVGSGVIAVGAVVLIIAFAAAYRNTRRSALSDATEGHYRASAVVETVARASAPPVVTNGLRMALEPGRGRTAVPIRSAYVGVIFGVVGVTAVLVFGSSLNQLINTPTRFGWTWGVKAADVNFTGKARECGTEDFGLTSVPGIAAVAAVCNNNIQLGGRPDTGWALTAIRGTIPPGIVAGRAPATIDEVALGDETMGALRTRIGATVQAHGPHGSFSYHVVGQAVFADLGDGSPLAEGALFTPPGLERVFDDNNDANRYLVGDFARGSDHAAILRAIATHAALGPPATVSLPVELDRLDKINWLPVTLAVLVGGLALVAVAHALVTTVHRRGRDIALLKTLGFTRAQVNATVAWQATTLGVAGLVVGLPVGWILGRVLWTSVANALGVAATVVVPIGAFLVVIVGTLLLVNAIALLPARGAARTSPALAFRSE